MSEGLVLVRIRGDEMGVKGERGNLLCKSVTCDRYSDNWPGGIEAYKRDWGNHRKRERNVERLREDLNWTSKHFLEKWSHWTVRISKFEDRTRIKSWSRTSHLQWPREASVCGYMIGSKWTCKRRNRVCLKNLIQSQRRMTRSMLSALQSASLTKHNPIVLWYELDRKLHLDTRSS